MENQKTHTTRSAEFVTPNHPDKLCDRIADALLDEYLQNDKNSRVALEVTGGHGQIFITGEVTSLHQPDIPSVVSSILGKNDFQIQTNIAKQSSEIAAGVDTGGAGDQGIVVGYACAETAEYMPREYVLARSLCQYLYDKYPVDGKVQVTLHQDQPVVVVASFQNVSQSDLRQAVKEFFPDVPSYIINPAGDWHLGGFDADSGTVGRKLAIDNYGPRVRIGGGAFSGKDLSKTDRSGAYFARHLAVNILKQTKAAEVEVELAFAIGVPQPVAMNINTIGGEGSYTLPDNMSPRLYAESLDLSEVSFAEIAAWGHFGRGLPWEA